MKSINEKLIVLSKVAALLNKDNVIWAVGGSLLLYFKGKTDHFNDIDIMVVESDANKLEEIIKKIGIMNPPNPNKKYKTKRFMEFVVDEVDIDVMAGFIIVKDNKEYDCSLTKEKIKEVININNEKIPLESLENWRKYYVLMGRDEKVKMIDK